MLVCTITEHTENQDIDIGATKDSVRKKRVPSWICQILRIFVIAILRINHDSTLLVSLMNQSCGVDIQPGGFSLSNLVNVQTVCSRCINIVKLVM